MKYAIRMQLDIIVPDEFLGFFDEIEDLSVVFDNDPNSMAYRIVKFTVLWQSYILITNRFDLTTYQIIMLYAYRWQIELFFRTFKRTFKGVHLMHENPHGIEAQFYLYLIAYVLLISFKQECEAIHELYDYFESDEQPHEKAETSETQKNFFPRRPYVCGLVTMLGEKLHKYWKIGLHWLTSIKNFIGNTI